MRSFYGEASNQGAAMPGKMPAEVLTPGKSSPRCYLDYAARADTSLAKGVAILRQLPSRADRRIQLSADLSDFSLTCRHESTDATSIASHL